MSWFGETILNLHNWWHGTEKIKSALKKTDNPLRIGIIAAAGINYPAIIDPVQTHPDAIITAIAARSKSKAEAQIAKYKLGPACKAYGSYDDIITDPTIEAVYIPTPNGLHAPWALKAMEAGKHVLVEKPIASNADEARQLRDVAQKTGKVLLEAFHWRFHPAAHTVQSLVESGRYGHVTSIDTKMSVFSGLIKDDDIRLNYSLAGGASMDLTYVYCASAYFSHPAISQCSHRILSAQPRINPVDSRIDDAMDTTFVIDPPADSGRPPVTCTTHCDLRIPSLFGFIPKIWATQFDTFIGLEKADVTFNGFAAPWLNHTITIKEKDTGTRFETKTFAGGPQWGANRGERWWTTYRYMLEAFVEGVRAKERGDEKAYQGPWMDMDESIKVMEIIDSVYERAGLPKRGESDQTSTS